MATVALQILGQRKAEIRITDIRELSHADIVTIETMPRDREKAIDRITARHHALARAVAQGIPLGQAAVACGYGSARASYLMADPTFKELVNYYQSAVSDAFVEAQRELASVMSTGAQVLQRRLEDDLERADKGEEQVIGTSQVLEIVTALADRTGHGVSSVQTTVTMDLAERMRERREAARRAATELAANARDITPGVAAE